ncbi:TPA: coagulase [Staphylococcus aureus]|nr:coagulase [Staphylococcus aureus]HDZ8768665.1 coagulase [Staphylococcus aureus]
MSTALELKGNNSKSQNLEQYLESLDNLLINQEVSHYDGYDGSEYKNIYNKYQKKLLAEIDAVNKFRSEEKIINLSKKNSKAIPEGVWGLTHERYESVFNALKDNKKEFEREVKKIEDKHSDLKRFSNGEIDEANIKLNELENKVLMLGFAFPKQGDARQDLYNKLDMIIGYSNEERIAKQPKNKRMFEETVKDLEMIIDEFFKDIGKQRPSEIPMLTSNNENNKVLAKNLREKIEPVEEKRVQENSIDKVVKDNGNHNIVSKAFIITEPESKPSLPIYKEEITKKPMSSIKQEEKTNIIYSNPKRFFGLSGESENFSISHNSQSAEAITNNSLIEYEEDSANTNQQWFANGRSQTVAEDSRKDGSVLRQNYINEAKTLVDNYKRTHSYNDRIKAQEKVAMLNDTYKKDLTAQINKVYNGEE